MEDFERPYKQVSRAKALMLFILRPSTFVEMAVKHDIAWQLSENPGIKAQYLNGTYKPNEVEMKEQVLNQAGGLRRSLTQSGLIVVSTVILALITGYFLRRNAGALSALISGLLQGTGAAILLWATLWQLTRDLQTFGGDSLSERVHSWLFSCLYAIGTALFFVAYTWQA
jgi:hypothetical protein